MKRLPMLLGLALTPALGHTEIPPELLGETGIANQTDGKVVFEDQYGGWALFGDSAQGCAVTYISLGSQKHAMLSFIGPDAGGSRGTLYFSGPLIPPVSKQRKIRVRLATDVDPKKTEPVSAFVLPVGDGKDHGAIAIATTMTATLKGILPFKTVWLELDGKEVFRIEHIGATFVARDALARCMKMAPIPSN